MPTIKLSQDGVNLREGPRADERYPIDDKNSTVTIGDLHGNSLKLVWFLLRQNVIQLNPVKPFASAEEVYARLVEIYETPAENLSAKDIQDFNQILPAMDVNPKASVRLIGDELADRGANDYFTLRIIEKLKICKVNVDILVSNHSVEFLDAYRKKSLHNPISNRLGKEQARSLFGLATLLEKGLVFDDEIESIVERYYKPSLNAISYSVNLEEDPPEITLFTHAPVGLETIQAAAQTLNIEYKDANIEELMHTIDTINETYYQSNIIIGDLFKQDREHPSFDMAEKNIGSSSISPQTPFFRMAWNRPGKSMMNTKGFPVPEVVARIPEEHRGYKVKSAHGHTGPGVHVDQDNVDNLDTPLGQGGGRSQEFSGDYVALYTVAEINSLQRHPSIPPIADNFYDTILGLIRVDYNRVKVSETPDLDAQVVLGHLRDIIKTYAWKPSGAIGHKTIEYKNSDGKIVKNKLPHNIAKIYDKTTKALQEPDTAVDQLKDITTLAAKAAISPKASFLSFKERAQNTQRMYQVMGEHQVITI
jgi:WipA-like, phosphatase domain